jgi:hypothetical protein
MKDSEEVFNSGEQVHNPVPPDDWGLVLELVLGEAVLEVPEALHKFLVVGLLHPLFPLFKEGKSDQNLLPFPLCDYVHIIYTLVG